jgi:hypothetical protein
MSDVQAGEGTGDAGSAGGESTELPNTEVTSTGADQGGEGGQGGEATGGESTGEAGGEGGKGGASTPEPKEDDVNKRFSKVTRERDEATRREREANENLRRALEALERANGGKKPEATPTPTPPADDIGEEPEPPEFIDPEQYQRDMAEYTRKVTDRTVKLQLRTERANQEREAAERANQEKMQAHARTWNERRTKALDEMPDYAEVAENPALHVTDTMAIAITSSEHGPKIAYHLGQHPDVAERIAKLPNALQLMEMGKLEVQITAPKLPKVSKTPEPIKVTTGTGEPQAKSDDELSMEEYAAKRSKRH